MSIVYTVPFGDTPNPPRISAADAPFGRDIRFDGNTRSKASSDYQTVEGPENLRRSLMRRAGARKGEYAKDETYGASVRDRVKGRANLASFRDMKNELRTEMLRDERVSTMEVTVERREISTGERVVYIRLFGEAYGKAIDTAIQIPEEK